MKVSIAVPVFDYYGFGFEMLDDMFRSFSQLTLKVVEVVVSDHSIDTEIEEYCDENEYDLNIKYIRNVEARGNPAVNTNNAIDHSTGEIIKIFQQDDFLYDTEALQKMYDIMNDSPAHWYACGAIHTRDDGHSFFNPMLPLLHEKMITDPGFNYIGGLSVLTCLLYTSDAADE